MNKLIELFKSISDVFVVIGIIFVTLLIESMRMDDMDKPPRSVFRESWVTVVTGMFVVVMWASDIFDRCGRRLAMKPV